jgi:PKD repeat protein
MVLGSLTGIDPVFSEAPDIDARADEAVTFTNVSEAKGLPNIDSGHATFSWGDYNNDDYVDLLIDTIYGPQLFENNGPPSWDFTNVTAAVGLGGPGMSNSVWGDYDNDGNLDIYTNWWEEPLPSFDDVLWHNEGPPGYTFTNVTQAAGGVTDIYPGKGNVWADVDRDGFLDIYVVNWRTGSQPLYKDYYWYNNGDGTFTNMSEEAGIYDTSPDAYRQPPYAGMGITSSDYNNDGWMDIYVSNYLITPNYLWENQRNNTFKNVAADKNAAGHNKEGYYGHSAGSAFGDFNNDGFMDIWVSDLAHKDPGRADMCDDSLLLMNNGPPMWNFTDIRKDTGIPITPKGTTQGMYYKDELYFSANWGDMDNDGDLDLFVPQVKNNEWASTYIWRNDGDGTFTNVTDTVGVKTWDSINGAWADYNNDGFLDIVTDGKAPFSGGFRQVRLWENSGNSNHWIKFNLTGTENNAPGIGSRVKITIGDEIQIREVDGGSGTQGSQNSLKVHFGLGSTTTVDQVEVRWPNGNVQIMEDLAADQQYDIIEDSSGPGITSISASKKVVNEDEQVTITATVSGSPASYEWDLDGDGTWDDITSTTQVSHVYTLAGTYYPGLRVLDANGLLGEYQSAPVKVENVLPVNSLVFNNTTYEDQEVVFDASASTDTPSDEALLQFNFSFGNGDYTGWTTNKTAAQTYTNSGTYNIGLEVKDDDEDVNGTFMDLKVVNMPPEATANESFQGIEDSPLELNGSGSDTVSDIPALEYKWDFGDGHGTDWSDVTGATHTYDEVGDYNATFYVKDDDGDEASVKVNVSITGVHPEAEILEPSVTVVNEDDTVSFDGQGSDTVSDPDLTFMWDFGDGNSTDWAQDAKTSHVYDRKGNYTAVLSVMDDDQLVGNDTVEITVLNVLPMATILEIPAELQEDEEGEFLGSGFDSPSDMPTLLFRWDFGDGNDTGWVTDPIVSHSYAMEGDFSIRFEVMDDDGEVHYLEDGLTVVNVLPDCSVKASKDNMVEDEEVVFSSTCTDTASDQDLTYGWKVGDKTYDTQNVTLVPTTSGQLSIEFTALDDEGGAYTEKLTVTIRNLDPVIGDLDVPLNVNEGETHQLEVNVSDTSSDLPGLTVTWEFQDGGKETGTKVNHTFAEAGRWKVKVTVEDDDGAKVSKEVTVTVTGETIIPPDDDERNMLAIGIGAGLAVLVVVIVLLYLFVLRPRSKGPETGTLPPEPPPEPDAPPEPTTTPPPEDDKGEE